MYTQKNDLQHNLPTPAQQKTRGGGQTDTQLTAAGKDPPKKDPTTTKNQDMHRANVNHSIRSLSSGDQGDYTTESHRSTTEVYTINPGDQNRAT